MLKDSFCGIWKKIRWEMFRDFCIFLMQFAASRIHFELFLLKEFPGNWYHFKLLITINYWFSELHSDSRALSVNDWFIVFSFFIDVLTVKAITSLQHHQSNYKVFSAVDHVEDTLHDLLLYAIIIRKIPWLKLTSNIKIYVLYLSV